MRLDNEEFLGFCVGARQKEYSAPTHLEAEWRKAGFEQAIHLRNGLSEFVDSFGPTNKNTGKSNFSGDPAKIDQGTADPTGGTGNYGADILLLMDCFPHD